jgi:hypothetical protein
VLWCDARRALASCHGRNLRDAAHGRKPHWGWSVPRCVPR